MEKNNVITTTNDQTSALLAETLNQIRADHFEAAKGQIESDYNNACAEMQTCRDSIKQVVDSNRGGAKGMHGFIGERMQVHISNADALVKGNKPEYTLLDDNGPVDYLRNNTPIQQKACQSDGRLGLNHVLDHTGKYPFFTGGGGVYQIPKDFYAVYKRLKDLNPDVAGKLRKEEYRLWKYIREYSAEHPDIKIEPMTVSYDEIQAGAIEGTLDKVAKRHKAVEEKRIDQAFRQNAANLKECVKVSLVSAGIESAVDAGLAVTDKLQSGKSLHEFDADDCKDIGKEALKGAGKGAIRGSAVYILTNTTAIPAPAATAGVTAVFGVTTELVKYGKGEISGKQCAKNSLWCASDVTVSAAASMLGAKYLSRFFPKKFRGAVIVGSLLTNGAAMFVYGLAKKKIREKFDETE